MLFLGNYKFRTRRNSDFKREMTVVYKDPQNETFRQVNIYKSEKESKDKKVSLKSRREQDPLLY